MRRGLRPRRRLGRPIPHAPIEQFEALPPEDLPADYFDLIDELEACDTRERMRSWALSTVARRAALPRAAQAKLRELTLEHQKVLKVKGPAAWTYP